MGVQGVVTDREREVLGLVAGHLTNADIGARLHLSVRTVESHVSSLMRKLDVADRRALARRAEELGLLHAARVRPWPRPASAFVGRAAETAAVQALLRQHRLVTVTGPGGVGKTRLALHAVQDLAPGGAWFADLSQVAGAEAVVPAVAAAVGASERPGGSLEEAVVAALAPADGLLVLDNCEHLLADVEALVARLLDGCPALSVLATSRAPLRAPYEWVYEVPALSDADAVRLFRSRAEAAGGVVPDDPRVGEICTRLDRMALAVELAAARYPGLGLDGLAVALGDPLQLLEPAGGGRQRSLRAAIAWSVDLLDEEARTVLAALSCFAGPFDAAAARAVALPAAPLAGAARALVTLADQHLLHVEPGSPTRYRFQEVVRQYAEELLGGDAGEVQRRHGRWAAERLAGLARAEHDDHWCAAFDRLAVEVRAALARGVGRRALGELFAEQLVQRGRLEESQRWFEALAADDGSDRVRLLRLAAGCAVARLVGDDALRLLDEAAAAALDAGDPDEAADALGWTVVYAAFHPGTMAHDPGDAEVRRRLAAATELAPPGSPAQATVAAAAAMCLPDDHPDAEPSALRAAEQARALGRPVLASAALDRACASRLAGGRYAEALAAVAARGELMDPLPLSAATAYAFNDHLLMGCEVSLAAGDLAGATRYAERLAALPCYRDDVHPALARRAQVDALRGDLAGAVQRGERFLRSWSRAGRHRAPTLAVGAYATALVHGLLGDDEECRLWTGVTEELLGGPVPTDIGWAPTLDAWLMLERDAPDEALARLSAGLEHPSWSGGSTSALMWRPWFAAALAEAVALCGGTDLERCRSAARGNPVAAALVVRAGALATGSGLAASAEALAAAGAAYQAARSRRLAATRGSSGR